MQKRVSKKIFPTSDEIQEIGQIIIGLAKLVDFLIELDVERDQLLVMRL